MIEPIGWYFREVRRSGEIKWRTNVRRGVGFSWSADVASHGSQRKKETRDVVCVGAWWCDLFTRGRVLTGSDGVCHVSGCEWKRDPVSFWTTDYREHEERIRSTKTICL